MAAASGLSKSASDALQSGLASQSAPPNPQTQPDPQSRMPFNELFYLGMRKIPRIIEQAMKHCPEGDLREPVLNALLKGTFPILKEGPQLADQIDDILRALFPLASPSLKAEVAAMFAPISPPVGPAGGAVPGADPGAIQGGAGAATGQPPSGPPPGVPSGEAGPPA